MNAMPPLRAAVGGTDFYECRSDRRFPTFTTYKTADQSVVDAYSIVKVDSGKEREKLDSLFVAFG